MTTPEIEAAARAIMNALEVPSFGPREPGYYYTKIATAALAAAAALRAPVPVASKAAAHPIRVLNNPSSAGVLVREWYDDIGSGLEQKDLRLLIERVEAALAAAALRAPTTELTPEDHEAIVEEASRRHHAYSRGVRGQTVRPQDFLEYWVATVTHERAAALRAPVEPVGWREMSTAPQDGTTVLLLIDDGTPKLGAWGTHQWLAEPWWIEGDAEGAINPDCVTHWAPLPASPPHTQEKGDA